MPVMESGNNDSKDALDESLSQIYLILRICICVNAPQSQQDWKAYTRHDMMYHIFSDEKFLDFLN